MKCNMLIKSSFTLLCIVYLIYYTCDVNICVKIDLVTHVIHSVLSLKQGVTAHRGLVSFWENP
jgi:hypothetical protein